MTTTRFAGLLGHEGVRLALSRAVDEGRLPSALLFHGPAGVGKLTAAVDLFRELLCQNPGPAACRSCDACRRISVDALRHPDVGLLYPQKKKEDGGDAEDEGRIAPDLHLIQDQVRRNPSVRILVDPTRRRLGELFLSPSGGRRRLLLILAAERLGEEAGNALLKVLEEPPARASLLLLCENLSALLPTLRSRCQGYRFAPLSRKVVAEVLRQRPETKEETARLVASLSGGRIGRALSLLEETEGYRQRRRRLRALLSETRRQRSAAAAVAAAQALAEHEDDSAEDLSVLMDLLRDAMMSRSAADPSLLTDAAETEAESGLNLTASEAAFLLVRVERAREDLRRFVNRQVALESLFLDLSGLALPRHGVE